MNSILFVGGTRSGKSNLAELWVNNLAENIQRANNHKNIAHNPVQLFIATAKASDEETKLRITKHKASRGESWQCLEAPCFEPKQIGHASEQIILMDCLTMWLNNLMAQGHNDDEILQKTEQLAIWIENLKNPIAIVSSELGQGMVPMSELARRYRDLHGLINQRIAKACKTVIFVSCGLPLALKGTIPKELTTSNS